MTDAVETIENHLRRLEERMLFLSGSFMSEADDQTRNGIQRELNALQIAVEHYKAALAIERNLHRHPNGDGA